MAKSFKSFSQVIRDVKHFMRNRIAYIQQTAKGGYYYYGETDELPNIILEGINNSGTATQAIKRKRQFILADGFVDPLTDAKQLGIHGKKLGELLPEIVENVTKLEGFALALFYNSKGYIKQVKPIPIPWIRREDDDTFIINRMMGEQGRNRTDDVKMKAADLSELPEVRGRRIISEVKKNKGKQSGELYYCYEKKLGRNYDMYPVPTFYSGFDDIISDGRISTLEMRNIVQGWRASIVISTGMIDDVNEDENGYTDLDKFNENISEFLGEDASPVLHLQGRTPEEMPTVTTIDTKEIVDMTEKATIRVGEKVCRLIGVPPVLVGFAKAGQLGNVQELDNMMSLFYMSIKEWQNWIDKKLSALKPLIENGEILDFEITRLNAFELLPEKVIDRLTDAQIAQLYELPEVEEEVIDEPKPIVEDGGNNNT